MVIGQRLQSLIIALFLFAGKAVLFFLFLVIAHPLVLVLVLIIVAMVILFVVVGGFLFVMAWMVALAMADLFIGPFWFWMSLTGAGAALCFIRLVGEFFGNENCNDKPTENSEPLATATVAVVACNIQGAEGKSGDGVENR